MGLGLVGKIALVSGGSWWGGNPLVNETIPGVKFQLPILSLRSERLAGRVRFYESHKH